MDNLSFIRGIRMPADISLSTRSPELGERPSDHFQGFQGSLSSLSDGGDSTADIMAMLDNILGTLSPEEQSSFGEWAKSLTEGDLIEESEIIPILGDIMNKLIAQMEESGMETQSLEELNRLMAGEGGESIALDNTPLNAHEITIGKSDFSSFGNFPGKMGDKGVITPSALIKDYVEGYRKIASHYGSPREYSFQDIVTSVSPSWHQNMPGESLITPLSIIGSGLAEYVGEQYREIGPSSHGKTDSPENMAGKQDMVLDKQMTQAIITRAMEVLNADNQRIKENEFTLKVHPRSLGEINVSVTANRDAVNIAIEAGQEAADRIKSDIVYFSNKYDNMEWRLNDEVTTQGSGNGAGDDEGSIGVEPLNKSLNRGGIINIII